MHLEEGDTLGSKSQTLTFNFNTVVKKRKLGYSLKN